MKDFFDLYVLSGGSTFHGPVLAEAIRATFRRRGSALPEEVPTGLSDGFAGDRIKRTRWSAFLHKSKLAGAPEDLKAVVMRLREFLLPPSAAVRTGKVFDRVWMLAWVGRISVAADGETALADTLGFIFQAGLLIPAVIMVQMGFRRGTSGPAPLGDVSVAPAFGRAAALAVRGLPIVAIEAYFARMLVMGRSD